MIVITDLQIIFFQIVKWSSLKVYELKPFGVTSCKTLSFLYVIKYKTTFVVTGKVDTN